ncbi:amidoligase family protein [Pontibacter locisalis]|uniref:Amidoligase family protein n=1 Tax=Pontibacter locisalis TaxID=1719035 RepID=A0ABW5IGC2_9BACT
MQYKPLPVRYNRHGKLRTVGFELEFSNLGIDEAVKIIQDLYGGEVQPENRFSKKVVGTALGDFNIEFDLTLLTEKNYKKAFDKYNIRLADIRVGKNTLEDEVETLLEGITGIVFPYEIATPPVPCTQIDHFEKLRQALYEHHAEGTKASLKNAFGTHINIEVPDVEPETIIRYLRALILLYPWLLQVGQTDFARRVSPFIDPYPSGYAALLLSPGYQPSMEELIEDYHKFNPDRNRPLDMYPLFAALKEGMQEQYTEIGKVKARETFHYRLPNSSISQPEWSLAEEWNNWVAVEELANDRLRLKKMSEAYLELKDNTLIGFEAQWAKRTGKWLS